MSCLYQVVRKVFKLSWISTPRLVQLNLTLKMKLSHAQTQYR